MYYCKVVCRGYIGCKILNFCLRSSNEECINLVEGLRDSVENKIVS